ncbi:MAG: 3 beta-hydroxysteroid dehydrogenase/Delta 5--_4-isomerase [Syntrophorhabdus sp. PtaU1.Bin153]|nr:MAG: 3 beta-hydroxysteroid dehydrogenase/Delta 5-->4-isomerase [Syntrophorhabdus sp. PtaU1.Bin153]
MNVLVTGATGAIGPRVVQALSDTGHTIRALSVDCPQSVPTWANTNSIIGDVTDPAVVCDAMRGIDAVIHLAALLHMVNPDSSLKGEYERINVGGTANILDAAMKAGVRRVVFFSTIAVYGLSNGKVLDEESPTSPDTIYGQTKLAAEQIVLNARSSDGQLIGTVLRLGAVYGSRIKGNYERLMHSLDRGRFVPIGNGTNRRTLVYDKDVARAAILAAQHPDAAGQIYNVSDGKFHTLNEMVSAMCGALGRKPPRLSLPVAPMRAAACILEGSTKLLGWSSPITRTMIDKYTEDIAVSSERIQTELAFLPHYDLQAGWKETVREMRESGAL